MDIDQTRPDLNNTEDENPANSNIERDPERLIECGANDRQSRSDHGQQSKVPEASKSEMDVITSPTKGSQDLKVLATENHGVQPPAEDLPDSQSPVEDGQGAQPPADQSGEDKPHVVIGNSSCNVKELLPNAADENVNEVGVSEDTDQVPVTLDNGDGSLVSARKTPVDANLVPPFAAFQEAPADASHDESTMEITDEGKVEGEESQSADDNMRQKRTRITNSKLMLKSLPMGLAADSLFEYQWPLNDDGAEYYMLQEQLSVFLDIKSFRRKYPDLERRQIDILERNYLKDVGVVTEMQCDLGLTALKSDDIAELMQADYPDKYEEYSKVLHKREEQRLAKKQQAIQEQHNATPQTGPVSKLDIKRLTERAVKSAANYNAFLSRERREERRHYFDIQTGIVQCAKTKYRIHPPELTRPSPYPVALIHGQYSSYYHEYSPDELKYLPVKTALYNPPLRVDNPYRPLPSDQTEEPPVQVPLSTPDTLIPSTVNPVTSSVVVTPTPRRIVMKLLDTTCCLCGHTTNRSGETEKCIKCSQCQRETHPSCCELTPEMLAMVVTYEWMCMDCKVCVKCSDPGNEDKMIVCDKCDRGYHTFCVGLKSIPEESIWACPECVSSS